MDEVFTDPTLARLRELALSYPETSEAGSCVNQAYKARKKNFVFLGEKPEQCRIMLKLVDGREAAETETADDDRVSVGDNGWVTMLFHPGEPPAVDLEAWVEESYRNLAPKTLVKLLDA